jgi:dihydroorotase
LTVPLTLTNFRAVAMPGAEALHVGDDGRLLDAAPPGARVIDCGGQFLSPGWCDLHVHVWHGGTDISVRAAQAGRAHGVTAMADAGSAGEANFHGLREYVIDPAAETIRAFLNIGSIGLVACNRVSELIDMRSIDVDRTLAVIEANRDVICGVKVRASGVIVGAWGITPAKIAKRIAEMTGLPLMVHVGEPPPLIDEIFDILTPRRHRHSLLQRQEGRVHPRHRRPVRPGAAAVGRGRADGHRAWAGVVLLRDGAGGHR